MFNDVQPSPAVQDCVTCVVPRRYLDKNIRDGVRSSSSSDYLRPALRRANLRVTSRAHVERVTCDAHRKQAVGVEFRVKGQRQQVSAEP